MRSIKRKRCETCGHRYKFRRWSPNFRKYLCEYCGNPTGKQEKEYAIKESGAVTFQWESGQVKIPKAIC